MCATAAGLSISITTSPFTNARTYMISFPGKYSGVGGALGALIKDHGIKGWFRGFGAQWLRFGPYATVQFLAWEELRRLFGLPGI
jgi:hypothetical protein